MKWIDSHCHLHHPWFPTIDDVISRAKDKGVEIIVNCSSDPTTFDEVENFSKNENVFHTLGIQPTLALKYSDTNVEELFIERIKDKLLAIGEVGLDYYWVKDNKEREKQKQLFIKIIDYTNDLNLPLVIHSRKAETDCLDILEKHAQVPVLLHSFDGNLKETMRAVDLGYFISVPTNVTIRKNRRKTAKRAGLESIMLETDAPFCAPDPKIERNEPWTIPTAGNYIAKLLSVEVKEVAESTSRNAYKFYSF